MKKNLEFKWDYDIIECRTEIGIYSIIKFDKWGFHFLDTSNKNEEVVLWVDSLLEAVQASQDHYESKGN